MRSDTLSPEASCRGQRLKEAPGAGAGMWGGQGGVGVKREGGGEVVLKRGERNREEQFACALCVRVSACADGRARSEGVAPCRRCKKTGARRMHVLPLSCSSFSNLNKISNFDDLSIINSIMLYTSCIISGRVRVQVVSSESLP
jgi:hypothetical protein